MMNYTALAALDVPLSKRDMCDVLTDVKCDVRALSLNLAAIAEQPNTIEGGQLSTLSDIAFYIDMALDAVLKSIPDERETVA